jgi:hypothetical protein
MIALVLLIGVVALGIASALGFTAETRDPGFGIGPLLTRPARPKVLRRAK